MMPDRRPRPAIPMPPPRAPLPPGAIGPPPGAGPMMGPTMGPAGSPQMQAKEQVKQKLREAYAELKSVAAQAGISWDEIEEPGEMGGGPAGPFPGPMMGE